MTSDISDRIDAAGIEKLARENNTSSDRIVCGYMRQPITYNNTEVKGMCALCNSYCVKKIPVLGVFYSGCDAYKSV